MDIDTELSGPHRKLISLLQKHQYIVESEVDLYPWKLDIYLPDYHVGVEVDGPQHGVKRESKRDRDIFELYGIPIIRIKAQDVSEDCLVLIAEFCDQYVFSFPERMKVFKKCLLSRRF